MNILKRLVKLVLFIISYSPIACLSDDKNFGSNEDGLKDFFIRIRISMFSIYIGAHKYYFLSKKKGEEFKLTHKLDLNQYYSFSAEDRDRIVKKQESYLDENMKNGIENDKEFIGYLFQSENNRKNITYNKINMYTTIILAIIPLILLFFKPEIFIKARLITKALIIGLLYIMFNIVMLILQSSKVKSYARARYADLKQSTNKEKEMVKIYYLEWQGLKYEVDSMVAFVKNIEKYIKGAIVVSVLITVLSFQINNNTTYSYNNPINSIVEVDINKLENKEETTVKSINSVNQKIADKNVSKIIVLYNKKEVLDNKSFKAIYSYFNIYRKENDIVLIKESSESENNQIKIILVEE